MKKRKKRSKEKKTPLFISRNVNRLSVLFGVMVGGASSHGSNSLCVQRLIVIGKWSLGCLENLLRNSIRWFPWRQPLCLMRSHNMDYCDYTVGPLCVCVCSCFCGSRNSFTKPSEGFKGYQHTHKIIWNTHSC